jgi:hypothetical protein
MPFIAKDTQTGFVVKACDGIKKRKYTCMCLDAHSVCLKQGLEREHHFAHVPVRGPDGREFIPSCRSGGESEEHIMAKHKLLELQGQYSFRLKTCEVCRVPVMEDCKNGNLKLEVQSDDKHWRYDVLYTRLDGTKLALEVYHTHVTGNHKIRSSMKSGIVVAEFYSGDILSMHAGTVLDNKRDASWICSDECHTIKCELEMAAREQARKKQQEIAEAKRQLELEAKRQTQMYERQAQMREQQQDKEAKRPRTCTAENHPVIHYFKVVPWNYPYAIVNNGRALSYGHPPKPELTLTNNPPPPYNTRFDYTAPIMGQPGDHKN